MAPVRARVLFACLVVAVLAAGAPVPALAGPPYQTDDPETVEHRHWEFYIASQVRHDRDGDTATLPHFEVNYGLMTNVTLHLIVPLVYDSPSGEQAHYGLGDIEAGVKFRFIQESDWVPMVATFPLVEIPTGNQDEGLGNGKAQYFIPLWLQKSWGPWSSCGGGGYWINPGDGNKDWWFWGWLVQREFSASLALGAELTYRTASVDDGDNGFGYNVGAVINITGNHHLLFSAGSDFSGPNRFSCYIGYQFTFGPEGK